MQELKKIVTQQTWLLTFFQWSEALLWGGLIFLVSNSFFKPVFIGLTLASLSAILILWYKKSFSFKRGQAIDMLHKKNILVEYSLPLLYKKSLNHAEKIQVERISGKKLDLFWPINFYLVLPFLLLIASFFLLKIDFQTNRDSTQVSEKTLLSPKGIIKNSLPKFLSAKLEIRPPNYTGLASQIKVDLNAEVYQGSALNWKVFFDSYQNLALFLEGTNGQKLRFALKNNGLELNDTALASGFYSLVAYIKDSVVYKSPMYSIQIVQDQAPVIKPASKQLYTFHTIKDPSVLNVSANFTDDFKVKQAFMVATVARGTGENVKFREVKWPLTSSEFKSAKLSKLINLKELNFSPGDELYYYWAAVDNKYPQANFTKSDTYFVVYKDTTNNSDTELSTMAMNILPEYFRSQRQIIIDTEKLIKNQKKIGEKQFKYNSNEIGYDQKVLRLRYGQYLGEEFEDNIGHATPSDEEGNWLEGFVHAHDSEEQGDNHVEHEHAEVHVHEHSASSQETDPLAALMEQYVHSHDDGELNTFYEQSTRSLLKMALEQMWQSELHLRLYEPQKALPFENRALEYLKQAQQKARAYVTKSGFDPPPIKENEKRLTGEMDKLNKRQNFSRTFMKMQVSDLVSEMLGLLEKTNWSQTEKSRLALMASELIKIKSGIPISELRELINGERPDLKKMNLLKSELLKLVGFNNNTSNPRGSKGSNLFLRDNFWKAIQ
jgi:hypothetical protein